METLPNGAQVLLRGDNAHEDTYVLAVYGADFVTWALDQDGNTFWPHYYSRTLDGLTDAVRDFTHRTEHYHPGQRPQEGEQP